MAGNQVSAHQPGNAVDIIVRFAMDVSEHVEDLRQVERSLVKLKEHLPSAYHQFLGFPQERLSEALRRLDIICGNATINAERVRNNLAARVRPRGEFLDPDKET